MVFDIAQSFLSYSKFSEGINFLNRHRSVFYFMPVELPCTGGIKGRAHVLALKIERKSSVCSHFTEVCQCKIEGVVHIASLFLASFLKVPFAGAVGFFALQ
jgi:hypothetical protein